MKSQVFRDFLCEDKVYKPEDIISVLDLIRKKHGYELSYTANKKTRYIDIPCSFDIETTSFYITSNGSKEKCAIMYEWTFGIMGIVIIGRTWEEFVSMMNKISDYFELFFKKRLLVYVHNLAFEFQFLRKYFKWREVLAVKSRTPLFALTNTGIEFRCSYLLSGYSLEKTGEHLERYEVEKLTGNLDYKKIRHSKTALSQKEIDYCVADVKVVMAYIAECAEKELGIGRIPLTKTGYVRRYCKNSCFYELGVPTKKSIQHLKYMELMDELIIDEEEYKQLKRAFQGGFTHANPFYVDKTLTNVTSYDFTSSYPAVMLSERFPMSRAEKVEIKSQEEFEKNLKLYCCMFDVVFEDLQPKVLFENYISESRCWKREEVTSANGRVVSAKTLGVTVTEQDWNIIKEFYTWKHVTIYNFRRYKRGYLPKAFIKAILKLYQDKTQLKGVTGKESEYQFAKELLNSCYGMIVTDVLRPEFPYSDHWLTAEEKKDKRIKDDVLDVYLIDEYNRSKSRFLFYPWGVWITAYARRNLFSGILEFKEDYVYSDTDSIKVLNAEKHSEYFIKYNDLIKRKLSITMNEYRIPEEAIQPETIKGIKKLIGVWDFDGHYKKFKTLGAKRYMVQYSEDERNDEEKYNKISLTVSGINKKKCLPWMLSEYGEEYVFEAFSDGLEIPQGKTGTLTHTYIDEERRGIITDYNGVSCEFKELSGVHLEDSAFNLGITGDFMQYIQEVQLL